jgi:hypothetical protein
MCSKTSSPFLTSQLTYSSRLRHGWYQLLMKLGKMLTYCHFSHLSSNHKAVFILHRTLRRQSSSSSRYSHLLNPPVKLEPDTFQKLQPIVNKLVRYFAFVFFLINLVKIFNITLERQSYVYYNVCIWLFDTDIISEKWGSGWCRAPPDLIFQRRKANG